jgi:hypothetical protein
MESVFLLLSGAIVMSGILYWFWSHIQLTQKKVQLLENAVFELRTMLNATHGQGVRPPSPAPLPLYQDLMDDDWKSEHQEEKEGEEGADVFEGTPLELLVEEQEQEQEQGQEEFEQGKQEDQEVLHEQRNGGQEEQEGQGDAQHVPSDLLPGGRIEVPEDRNEMKTPTRKEVKSLLEAIPEETTDVDSEHTESSQALESMPLKELRRLAEQRGVTGSDKMRKRDLLAILRQQVTPMETFMKEFTE